MLKLFKYLLTIVIVFFLFWYLAGHWQDVKVLLKLNVYELSAIYLISLVGAINSALVVMTILNPMGIKTFLGDMIMLQNACILLNYVPMKFGTLFFANYLKRHYGLKYSHFGTFSIFLTLLISVAACFSGAIVVIFVYGLGDIQKQILVGAFMACLIASLLMIFIPLPVPKGSSKFSGILRDFILSRKVVTRDVKTLFAATLLLFLNFVLMSVKLAIIYHSMNVNVHPAGFLVLGALGYIVLFFNFTPGALGIREAVLGAGAVILGVPLEVGITAALIDRAITLTWAFVVGGVCTAWIWHKSPADFRENQAE